MNGRTSSKQLIINRCQVSTERNAELFKACRLLIVLSMFSVYVGVFFFYFFFYNLLLISESLTRIPTPTLYSSAYHCFKGNLALQFFVSVGNELAVKQTANKQTQEYVH